MWHAIQHEIEGISAGQRYCLLEAEQPLTYIATIELWQNSSEFRTFFCDLLSESSFRAYRWETPPVNQDSVHRQPFEFVLLNCEMLERSVDTRAFSDYFSAQDSIVAFDNIGGDAELVVPCPVGREHHYGHLAAFIREAPETQVHQLWQTVARSMRNRLSDTPVWLSTAGMGVAWLHVRLDSRPKYYGHTPYKVFDQ